MSLDDESISTGYLPDGHTSAVLDLVAKQLPKKSHMADERS